MVFDDSAELGNVGVDAVGNAASEVGGGEDLGRGLALNVPLEKGRDQSGASQWQQAFEKVGLTFSPSVAKIPSPRTAEQNDE